jgi:hypothetical protein
MALIDTGDEKKVACTGLGAEKWIDFSASENLVADVIAAAGEPGPHAAMILTPSVRNSHLLCSPYDRLTQSRLAHMIRQSNTFVRMVLLWRSECLPPL